MDPVQGMVLGVVQGLGEFLPISSSGHLIIVPWLLGWPDHSQTFDVALHMGTLFALLIYFWRDWWNLVGAWLPSGGRWFGPATAASRWLGLSIVAGSVPAAVAGLVYQDVVESALRVPWMVAVLLIVGGVLLSVADRAGLQRNGMERIGLPFAVIIGCAQALALAPGVSRSGITLTAGLLLGFTRPAATRFSFLLSMPITAGAGVLKLRHLVSDGIPADEQMAFVAGIVASFVVGLIVIGGLLRYVRTQGMDVFTGYRLTIGVIVLTVTIAGLR